MTDLLRLGKRFATGKRRLARFRAGEKRGKGLHLVRDIWRLRRAASGRRVRHRGGGRKKPAACDGHRQRTPGTFCFSGKTETNAEGAIVYHVLNCANARMTIFETMAMARHSKLCGGAVFGAGTAGIRCGTPFWLLGRFAGGPAGLSMSTRRWQSWSGGRSVRALGVERLSATRPGAAKWLVVSGSKARFALPGDPGIAETVPGTGLYTCGGGGALVVAADYEPPQQQATRRAIAHLLSSAGRCQKKPSLRFRCHRLFPCLLPRRSSSH